MTTRADIHSIVDELSDAQLEEAKAYLDRLRSNPEGSDLVAEFLLAAPYDDEPFTEEDRVAVEQSRRRDTDDPPMTWDECKARIFDD